MTKTIAISIAEWTGTDPKMTRKPSMIELMLIILIVISSCNFYYYSLIFNEIFY